MRVPSKRIGLVGEAAAVVTALLDKRTPWPAKAISAAALLYLFSPIDGAPDFIPLVGWLDDLVLAPLAMMLASRFIPPAVMDDARARFAKKSK